MFAPQLRACAVAALAVACLAADVHGQAAGAGVAGHIRGRLEGVVTPLPHAMVEASTRAGRWVTTADTGGRYAFAGLEPGTVTLHVTHVGYQALTVTVTIPEQASVSVDLELMAVPVALPPVTVLGDAADGVEISPGDARGGVPLPELDLQALEVGPGVGQSGLADVVAALPGNDPGNATDILFMRGSTADLKLVLLDGVPVYTPFHVAGLMTSFERDVLGAAVLHVGGAPARFDGGLTNILELRTRTARRDRLRVSGALDLLAASAALETPLGSRAGVLASARTLHGLGEAPLGGAAPYGYRDGLLALSAEPVRGHEVRATGFWNEESVLLDATLASASASWVNRAGSVGYRGTAGGARFDLTAGLSAYRASLPLQSQRPAGSPVGTPLPPTLLAGAAKDRVRALGEVTWGSPSAPVRSGLSFEHLDERFTARAMGGGTSSSMRGSGNVVGTFLDVTRPLGDGLTLRAGVRADHFGGGRTLVAPRAAVMWEVDHEALVTVAAGRYHQPTRTTDLEVERALESVTTGGFMFEDRLGVASADHLVVELDQRLGETARMGLAGFWKSYRGLPSFAGESVRSSGVDFRVVTAADGRAAWLGYGLSWFWSTVDLSGRASEFVGRHLLSAGVSGSLLGPIEAEARVAYGAGLPYTSIPFRSETNPFAASSTSSTVNQIAMGGSADPLPPGVDESFLRVDVELHALLEPTWIGRPWRVRPYIRVLNALDRRDALFYTYQPWRSPEVMPLAERSVLPIVGVAFSF